MQIIRRVLDGHINDFEALVLDNQKKVYNLALKMTKNTEDAYDISQEAFIKAYNALKNFRGDSSFGVWIYRLTSNLCIDFLRREKKRKTSPLVYINDSNTEQEIEISDVSYEPEALYEKAEIRQAISDGLEKLPEDHRQVLILRELGGLSYAEIAETLNLEIGTVKSRIFRARSNLVKYLSAQGNFFCKASSKEKKGE
ncbi:MAG: sigma-70 family RNA polymerase sigma factor [Clostridiales bacterium]|nr:sigma-70 family RNA polymerase sigma factor [Clostridiales bacterium]